MAKINLYVFIKKNTTEKDGKPQTWTGFRTPMNLVEKGKEEKGIQHFLVDVVFLDKEEKAKVEKMKGRIRVTVNDTEISAPSVYQIRKKKDASGKEKNEYPKVFIEKFIEAVSAPKPVKQSAFTQDEDELEETREEAEEETPY